MMIVGPSNGEKEIPPIVEEEREREKETQRESIGRESTTTKTTRSISRQGWSVDPALGSGKKMKPSSTPKRTSLSATRQRQSYQETCTCPKPVFCTPSMWRGALLSCHSRTDAIAWRWEDTSDDTPATSTKRRFQGESREWWWELECVSKHSVNNHSILDD